MQCFARMELTEIADVENVDEIVSDNDPTAAIPVFQSGSSPNTEVHLPSLSEVISPRQHHNDLQQNLLPEISFSMHHDAQSSSQSAAIPELVRNLLLQEDSTVQITEEVVQSELQLHGSQQPTGQVSPNLQLSLLPDDANHQLIQMVLPIQAIPSSAPKKRKSRKRPTPIVDDEIKRSTRLNKILGFEHMELDATSKPRKLFKEDTTLMQAEMQDAMDEVVAEDQMLQVAFMQNIAINYCGVAPKDATEDKLLANVPNVNDA